MFLATWAIIATYIMQFPGPYSCNCLFLGYVSICMFLMFPKHWLHVDSCFFIYIIGWYLLSIQFDNHMHFVGFTDSLGILVEHLDTDLRDVKELTLIILYNLCVGYRSKIFSNGKQHPITNHVTFFIKKRETN